MTGMGGMGGGLAPNDPTIVAAFHRALLHQGLVAAGLALIVLIAWNVLRGVQLRQAASTTDGTTDDNEAHPVADPEPAARRLLRIGFGLLWLFDGILQGQASMPTGLIPQVVQPSASGSPGWVQHLVNSASSVWQYHPVTAAAAAVWIQVGIGLWLLVAPRGNWSRLAGVAGAGWGLLIWICAEAFGEIFAPGLTWLFGAPGAALFYVVAGVLVALPDHAWTTPRLGRGLLRGSGVFLVGMAILQAWPGRGFWQGQTGAGATPGTLTTMVQEMSKTPQPHPLGQAVSAFAGFDAAHGWAVNLVAVTALALIGCGFLTAEVRIVRPALIAAIVLGLADWLFVEDLGFLGGVGTDPNSMIPMLILFGSGYLALTRPALAEAPVPARRRWAQRLAIEPAYALRAVAGLAAVGVTGLGVAPMAVAATDRTADPIITRAIDGPVNPINAPAPPFQLSNEQGQPVGLPELRGKVVAITFLDPVCTTDCPIIAREFRLADRLLGRDATRVEMVAVDANPRYITPDYLNAFDRAESMDTLSNWGFLTGSLPRLQQVWKQFGVQITQGTGGAMVDHTDIAYIIDPAGNLRDAINTAPGPATAASTSSFASTLAGAIRQVLRSA